MKARTIFLLVLVAVVSIGMLLVWGYMHAPTPQTLTSENLRPEFPAVQKRSAPPVLIPDTVADGDSQTPQY